MRQAHAERLFDMKAAPWHIALDFMSRTPVTPLSGA
jgi:hypothetical protein